MGTLFAVLSYGTWSVAQILPKDTFLSIQDVKKRWGHAPFDAAKFKASTSAERAKMAVSMLENHKPFVGKTLPELREMLGEQTGYYRLDMLPAKSLGRSYSYWVITTGSVKSRFTRTAATTEIIRNVKNDGTAKGGPEGEVLCCLNLDFFRISAN